MYARWLGFEDECVARVPIWLTNVSNIEVEYQDAKELLRYLTRSSGRDLTRSCVRLSTQLYPQPTLTRTYHKAFNDMGCHKCGQHHASLINPQSSKETDDSSIGFWNSKNVGHKAADCTN
ncbi:hypothetical protein CEP54_014029 [Fusarium duplospermum]|uniref:Uncharacterized protein n=1 Tax=Fusarium duplospermum TaxID=1325734 RepID=A0A428NZ69_9HYPO|nr:hypothetical protein CEP54_014029 [Fusarium duplospermum]